MGPSERQWQELDPDPDNDPNTVCQIIPPVEGLEDYEKLVADEWAETRKAGAFTCDQLLALNRSRLIQACQVGDFDRAGYLLGVSKDCSEWIDQFNRSEIAIAELLTKVTDAVLC